jgi:hypothetical protein
LTDRTDLRVAEANSLDRDTRVINHGAGEKPLAVGQIIPGELGT